MNFDLVACEVAQVGDDGGLLGVDGDDRLCAFQRFPVLGGACAVGRAGGGGEEGEGSVGDANRRPPMSGASKQGKSKCTRN